MLLSECVFPHLRLPPDFLFFQADMKVFRGSTQRLNQFRTVVQPRPSMEKYPKAEMKIRELMLVHLRLDPMQFWPIPGRLF